VGARACLDDSPCRRARHCAGPAAHRTLPAGARARRGQSAPRYGRRRARWRAPGGSARCPPRTHRAQGSAPENPSRCGRPCVVGGAPASRPGLFVARDALGAHVHVREPLALRGTAPVSVRGWSRCWRNVGPVRAARCRARGREAARGGGLERRARGAGVPGALPASATCRQRHPS